MQEQREGPKSQSTVLLRLTLAEALQLLTVLGRSRFYVEFINPESQPMIVNLMEEVSAAIMTTTRRMEA